MDTIHTNKGYEGQNKQQEMSEEEIEFHIGEKKSKIQSKDLQKMPELNEFRNWRGKPKKKD